MPGQISDIGNIQAARTLKGRERARRYEDSSKSEGRATCIVRAICAGSGEGEGTGKYYWIPKEFSRLMTMITKQLSELIHEF